MPDLIAQGPQPHNRWRRKLPDDRSVVVGRASADWATPWDDYISRHHVSVTWDGKGLQIVKLPEGRNPVFFRGQPVEQCLLRPGEHFVVGNTSFTLLDEEVAVVVDGRAPANQQSFKARDLRRHEFRDADQRIAVLSRLPEVISGAANDNELVVRLVNLLLTGIPQATAAAVVERSGTGELRVLHWDRRATGGSGFAPSERLIRQALDDGESVMHVWDDTTIAPPQDASANGATGAGATSGGAAGGAFTLMADVDWAFCTPAPGQASRGWAIYVAGAFRREPLGAGGERPALDVEQLRDDVKFTELAAATMNNLRTTQQLVRRQASLSQFFSPVVLDALAGRDPDEVLAPREAEVAVLFCDLRGFSRTSERSAGDLLGLLNRVSRALGVMTRHILEQGGVVGDFHGDAAMGFWGWPLSQDDAVERACRAALGIRADFAAAAQQPDHPLSDFRIGVGVATGRAVAGKIGSVDQVKVTVFGPVVNLASRLEEMTKQLRASVLIDERTAAVVRRSMAPHAARVRRVAIVRPYGLSGAIDVSELLPPVADYPQLSDEQITIYEQAVAALLGRDWPKAFHLLHQVPADDRVKDFLTVFIAQHNRTPPEGWDGVVALGTK